MSFPRTQLNRYASPHDVIVERRPTVVGHQHGFNEIAHLIYIFAKSHRCFKPLVIGDIWHNDSHINVAPGVGIAFGIRAEHHDFGIPIEARQYHLLVLSDKLEGFIACEHFWSIHCCNCLVCSTICLVFSSFSMFAMLRL